MIRFHDDFPGLRGVTGLDDESSCCDIWMMAASVFQHPTQVYFVEPAVLHAFQQVGGQFQFPCPPRWPLSCLQNRLVNSPSFVSSAQRQPSAAAALIIARAAVGCTVRSDLLTYPKKVQQNRASADLQCGHKPVRFFARSVKRPWGWLRGPSEAGVHWAVE